MSERLRDVRTMSESDLEQPRGLGGWLIVFAVLLALNVMSSAYTLLIEFMLQLNNFASIDPSEVTGALWPVLVWFQVIGMALVLALAVLSLITLFMQDRRFPKLAISYLIANAAFWVIQAILRFVLISPEESSFSFEWTVALGPIIFAVVWIAYFQKSVRMRNTFPRESVAQENR